MVLLNYAYYYFNYFSSKKEKKSVSESTQPDLTCLTGNLLSTSLVLAHLDLFEYEISLKQIQKSNKKAQIDSPGHWVKIAPSTSKQTADFRDAL